MRVSNPTVVSIHGDRDSGRGLNWAELWRYRELLYFFTWRDLTVRYKQTALGGAWAVIHPLLSAGVFSIFFGAVARLPSDGIPYSIFTFSGLLLWLFFANTMGRCSSSLVGNAHLLNKVYFPRLLLPAASVFPGLLDFMIASVVLFLGMVFYGWLPPVQAIVWVPLVLAGVGGLSLGFGMALGALNVRYRDVNNGIAFLTQMWMFATPVVYPLSLIDPKYRWIAGFNPMVGYMETFRAGLFAKAIPWPLLGVSLFWTVAVLALGTWYFNRVEKTFADIV